MQKVPQKHARTCKKLPVASFCASETAETGRIANGREQGDHVSRRRLRPATSIQISARYEISAEMTGHHQVTGHTGHCNLPGYRRLGFESVRKGYHSTNARLRSFEKGMFCCKLTVADDIRKGLLHVSLGAVGN